MDDLRAVAPAFEKLTQDFLFGDIWKRPGLSQRDKSLIPVTCLVALDRIEHVDIHLRRLSKTVSRRKNLWRQLRISHFTPVGPPQSRGLLT
jgi:4-carboxymuconolactone decarboxylase